MKSRLWKRLTTLVIWGSVAVVLVCCYFYWNTWRKNPEIATLGIQLFPEEAHIGTTIRIEASLEMPWYRKPVGTIELGLPDGLQVLDGTKQKLSRLGFGTWRWKSVLELQAYDFGPFQNLVASIGVTPDKNNENGQVSVTLPEISITPKLEENVTELQMSSELTEEFLRQRSSKRWKWGLILFATVMVAGIVIYYLLRPKHQKIQVPPKPWVVAESLVCELEGRLPLDAQTVFVELTDIIRRYIEAVYRLPATERTTPEFLEEMKRGGSQLSTEQGLLLTDFLTAADMVKFARLSATQSQIEDALKKAKRFIVETSEPIVRSQATEKQK